MRASLEEEDKGDNNTQGLPSRRRPLHSRLKLGTFADGQSIYRNQLRDPSPESSSSSSASTVAAHAASDHPETLERSSNGQQQQQHGRSIRHRHQQKESLPDDNDEEEAEKESFSNGHVHIGHLVLPETTSALLTSFGSPEFSWLESWLGGDDDLDDDVTNVLVVHQGNGLETENNNHLNEIGTAKLSPLPFPRVVEAVVSKGNDDDDGGSGGGVGGGNTSKENQTSSSTADSNRSSSPPQIATTKKQRSNWYQMFIKPHMGLMHCKLCLFRNQHGLRVVICGANLSQNQWERQRDVLWIQDFFNTTATTCSSCNSNNKSNRFGDMLYKFCRDLTICASPDDQSVVDKFLYLILGFNNEIDFSTAAGTIVYSFPRRQQDTRNYNSKDPSSSCTHRGGWKMLGQAAQEQFKLQRHRDKDHNMPSTIADVVLGLKKRHDGGDVNSNNMMKRKRRQGSITNSHTANDMTTHIKTIHVMSGSLGDVTPDFLEQMKNALRGLQESATARSRNMSWDAIVAAGSNSPSNGSNSSAVGWQIYWPSQDTAAKTMTMQSIRGNMRAIPKAYWQTIPTPARQALFADVVHNPLKASGMTGSHCYPNSHAKVILSLPPLSPGEDTHRRKRNHNIHDDDDQYGDDDYYSDDEMDESSLYNILYVGSHNFSISAWGLHDTPPKNVELGIVLTTTLREQRREWVQRLPYKLSPLSSNSSTSTTSRSGSCSTTGGGCFASDANYVPASGWEGENMDEMP